MGTCSSAFDENRYKESIEKAADFLRKSDNIIIMFHEAPDGDAIGSAYALCNALQKMGKKATCRCSDDIPAKYDYLSCKIADNRFAHCKIVAVDMAAANLFGEKCKGYAENTDLCIDHHVSNTFYARLTVLNPLAAATCEIVLNLLNLLNVDIDKNISNCIYTGLATDTGCFRYSNTTPKTLRCAADMIEKGAESALINKRLFETNTRQRMEIEREAMNTLEYYYGEKVALICITQAMCQNSGVRETELEGVASLPSRIEGVLAGITIKEKQAGIYKISLRTNGGINASEICAGLGGGGHAAAAGCQLSGTLDEVKKTMVDVVGKALENKDGRNLMH